MRPPPTGIPLHKACCSGRHIARMRSASRGSIGGIGPSGATAGVGPLAAGAPAEDAAADGEGEVAPPPTAATALWHAAVSLAAWLLRHCSASMPPGCTPEQFAMKSERQAARMADFCASVGAAAGGADALAAGGGAGVGACEAADFLVFVVALRSGAAGGVSAAGGGEP